MKLAALAFAAGFIAAAALNVPAADMNKVLRTAYRSGESKLDPQAESDEASGIILDQIFDSLLEYDYLARPAKLRPRAAAALPELNATDFGFPYVLAMPATSAVAREVAEYYGDDFQSHPVGTGPYLLKSWTRGSKIVLEANPGFRQEYFEGEAGDDPRSHEIAARLKGQRLPIVGRIEIYVIDEDQPRWLAFLNNEHDYIRPVPEDFGQIALPNGELAPNLKKRGITTTPGEIAWVTYTTFNLQTEIDGRKNDVGGYTPERIALRRAIAMAYRIDEQVALL